MFGQWGIRNTGIANLSFVLCSSKYNRIHHNHDLVPSDSIGSDSCSGFVYSSANDKLPMMIYSCMSDPSDEVLQQALLNTTHSTFKR